MNYYTPIAKPHFYAYDIIYDNDYVIVIISVIVQLRNLPIFDFLLLRKCVSPLREQHLTGYDGFDAKYYLKPAAHYKIFVTKNSSLTNCLSIMLKCERHASVDLKMLSNIFLGNCKLILGLCIQ